MRAILSGHASCAELPQRRAILPRNRWQRLVLGRLVLLAARPLPQTEIHRHLKGVARPDAGGRNVYPARSAGGIVIEGTACVECELYDSVVSASVLTGKLHL